MDAAAAFAALSVETRLSLIRLLMEAGPTGLPAGDIAASLRLPASTTSFHLAAEFGAAGAAGFGEEGEELADAGDADGMDDLAALAGGLGQAGAFEGGEVEGGGGGGEGEAGGDVSGGQAGGAGFHEQTDEAQPGFDGEGGEGGGGFRGFHVSSMAEMMGCAKGGTSIRISGLDPSQPLGVAQTANVRTGAFSPSSGSPSRARGSV